MENIVNKKNNEICNKDVKNVKKTVFPIMITSVGLFLLNVFFNFILK